MSLILRYTLLLREQRRGHCSAFQGEMMPSERALEVKGHPWEIGTDDSDTAKYQKWQDYILTFRIKLF